MTDGPELSAAKRAVRAEVRRTRAARSVGDRQAGDRARAARILSWIEGRDVGSVAAYLSTGDEPGTGAILDGLAARGLDVLLPVSSGGGWSEPAWGRYAGTDRLRQGPRSILEPVGPVLGPEAVTDVDVVLCPGLAGTSDGDRLGRGGGWYDRVLPMVTAPVVLLLNDDEVLAALPTGPLDRRVDLLLTPTRLLTTRAR